ncbi:MAG TPA: DUF4143 domain-containing protein [Egibacteraceae bacterium]|nr:DUF4143 domain-containing protein [Egibacteraceae bacterium]
MRGASAGPAQEYLPRVVDEQLARLVASLPAVAVEGPKAVGKTETARRVAAGEVLLDRPAARALAEADPDQALSGPAPLLLDEWQLVPPVWDAVRRAVDVDPSPGRFVLTGSARPQHVTAHTGAGRVVSLRMRPMTLPERRQSPTTVSLAALLSGARGAVTGEATMDLAGYASEIVASGFPGLRALGEGARTVALDGYVDQIIQRDVPESGYRLRRPETLRRWLRAFAAATGTTASLEAIRDAATAGDGSTPAKVTVLAYHGALERLWVVDDLPGWAPSLRQLTKVGQAPARHLADPALAAALLGVDTAALLSDGVLLGRMFESLAALSVRVFAQAAGARVWHLRTHGGGHEIDLIVERRDGAVVAIEVKLGSAVDDRDVAHLRWLASRIGERLVDIAVVHSGPHAYRRRDGVAVIPLELLGP